MVFAGGSGGRCVSDKDDYRPIACGLHSELELLAMHRESVRLVLPDGEAAGRVVDLVVHDGAEFLVLESAGGRAEIRLDRIGEIRSARPGVGKPSE